MTTRLEIANGEKVEHKGDLTVEHDIGEGAELIVTDGSLIVKGNIAKGAKIKLISTKKANVTISGEGIHLSTYVLSASNRDGIRAISETKEEPPKMFIQGCVSNEVIIESDATIEIGKNIGERCFIRSEYGELRAKDIGTKTQVEVYGHITARDVGAECTLTSKSFGLNANNIADGVNVKTHNAIVAKNIGKHCNLNSSSSGLEAKSISDHTDLEVFKHILIDTVGDYCTLKSKNFGFRGGVIGKSVVINTFKDLSVQHVGDGCSLNSSSNGITVFQITGNNVTMQAFKDIFAGHLGHACTLISRSHGVKVAGNAGDNLTINAYKSIEINNIGVNAFLTSRMQEVSVNNLAPCAEIQAFKDIIINGVCPIDAKLHSSRGKVRKNGPVREMSFFSSQVEEKRSNPMPALSAKSAFL